MKKAFVFIGRSGCGKGTQADMLIEYLKKKDGTPVFYMESGDTFRKFIENGTYSSHLSRMIYERGDLQPEFLAIWVWSNLLIEGLKGDEHLVLDGTPRKLDEARVLETAFDFFNYEKPAIIHVNISREEAKKRLLKRHREDDKDPKEVDKRLDWFETEVMPAIEFYRNNQKYNFVEIDGEQDIDKVHGELVEKVGNF